MSAISHKRSLAHLWVNLLEHSLLQLSEISVELLVTKNISLQICHGWLLLIFWGYFWPPVHFLLFFCQTVKDQGKVDLR